MATKNQYTKIFDKQSLFWYKEQDQNYLYLKSQEDYANDIFRMKGYLFLKEVYDMLGIRPITKESIVMGWHEKYNNADRFISFNIHKLDDSSGIELTFNVDGNILDFFEGESGE